jgi:radical SAM superfamily enzyme YgiQ (UPF0313 family)
LPWTGSSSIDIAFDDEALKLAQASRCVLLFIGFETIYPQKYKKTSIPGVDSPKDYIKAIRKIQSYGIKVKGGFILGFDDCTHKYCFELLKFLIKSNIDYADVTTLFPLPGSKLFERYKAEGRITTYNWAKYDPSLPSVFKPKSISKYSLYAWFVVLNILGMTPPISGLRFFVAVLLSFFILSTSFFIFFSLFNNILNLLITTFLFSLHMI